MGRIIVAIAVFLCLTATAFAEAPVGVTGFEDPQFLTVVGESLAEKVPYLPLYQYKSTKDDPVVFPETYVAEDNIFAWKIDTATGDVTEFSTLPTGLSSTLQAAVEKAPTWLQAPLLDRFLHMSENYTEDFADLILNPSDERYVDEIAYCVAMMGERDLRNANMDLLLEQNAALIYEYDAYLDYVEVVDTGSPGKGDYYTTVRYVVKEDGIPVTYELPMEHYYRYIVHPKLDMEEVKFVDPATGLGDDPADNGKFWRDYLYNDVEGDGSYTMPYFLKEPNVIAEADLQSWGNTADAYFAARSIYNIDAVLHQNGEPVLVEFAYGKGTVIASTMNNYGTTPAAKQTLLDNMLSYGCGDMDMPVGVKIMIVTDETDKGTTASYVNGRLQALGHAPTEIYEVNISNFPNNLPGGLVLDDFYKIIVPQSQGHTVYEAFADGAKKGVVETWLSGGYRVLQLDLVTSVDITDITFIGGLVLSATTPTDTVTIYGRPLLSDIIAGADHVWDGEIYSSLSGDRPFSDDGTMALRLIGNWIGKNMMDNIAEQTEKFLVKEKTERAIEPVRIVYNHFGNCGEDQDVWTAALRTLLIPGLNVSDINEDHVWNEFYHDEQWYYLQNDWSNGPTRIATPGGSQDEDYGGGKTTSFIFGWEGNGEIFSVIDRYSNYVTLKVTVVDTLGEPVPGAKVAIASESYYPPNMPNISFYMFTDANGVAQTTLGDSRNYWMRIEGGAGNWPADSSGSVSKIIDSADATPGANFEITQEMPDNLKGEMTLDDTMGRGKYGIHLTFDTLQRFQHLVHAFNMVTFTRMPENLGLDVYVVNEENFKNCGFGRDQFTTAQVWEGQTTFDEDVFPPDDGQVWYVVVSNHRNPQSTVTMNLDVQPAINPNPDDDDDDDDDNDTNNDDDLSDEASAKSDDDGCGCGC